MRGLMSFSHRLLSPKHLALTTFVAAIVCFSIGNIITKFTDVGTTASAFYRLFLAMPMGWAWLYMLPQKTTHKEYQDASLIKIVALGISCGVFFGAEIALLHYAYFQGSVGISIFLNGLSPFFVILGNWIIFGEKPGWKAPLCLLLATPGVFLLAGAGNGVSLQLTSGNIAAILSAVALAGFILSASRLRKYKNASSVMNWTNASACLFLAPMAVLTQDQLFPAAFDGWLILLAIAFISQVLGMNFYTTALGLISPMIISISTLAQPILTMALAWWILNEALTLTQIIGGAIVLIAIGYNNLKRT